MARLAAARTLLPAAIAVLVGLLWWGSGARPDARPGGSPTDVRAIAAPRTPAPGERAAPPPVVVGERGGLAAEEAEAMNEWSLLPTAFQPAAVASAVERNIRDCPAFRGAYLALDCSEPPCAVAMRGLGVASIMTVACAPLPSTPQRVALGSLRHGVTVYFAVPLDVRVAQTDLEDRAVGIVEELGARTP